MALLAEEIVEEWLNRQGYFTVRGARLGVHEMDILAVRPTGDEYECRHIEIQASVRPVSYISSIPINLLHEGQPPNSVKRTTEQLREGVKQWVVKKFHMSKKQALKHTLCPCKWSAELVVHNVRHPQELALIKEQGVLIHRLKQIVDKLAECKFPLNSAGGGDFVDLVLMGKHESQQE